MKRDTKIVAGAVSLIPLSILGVSTLCTWAVANGASTKWRVPFLALCHGIVTRCLTLFGEPMPICARCTGIYLGMVAGLVAYFAVPWIEEKFLRVASFVALAPLAIDGLTQLAGLRESTNPLRMATGITAGVAFGMWVLSAVERPVRTRATAS